jgi:hypothetical protein
LAGALACGEPKGEPGEVPSMLRTRFQSEMKAILHDLKAAEETAAALEGRYLELAPLREKYLSRAIPTAYELSVTQVSAQSFRAEVVHGASGLRCHLEVGVGAGRGVPVCP